MKRNVKGVDVVAVDDDPGYNQKVAQGDVTGTTYIHKFGENPNIASGVTEHVWDESTTHTWLTADTAMEIVSDNATDTSGGVGARTVFVQGQNLAGTEQTETLTMNGTTAVALANTYVIIYRAYVVDVGSANGNVGTIDVQVASGGAVQASIRPTLGQTFMAWYRVPASKTAYLHRWDCRITGKTSAIAEFTLWAKKDGEGNRAKDRLTACVTGATDVVQEYPFPPSFPALTRIWVTASPDTNNTSVGSTFDLLLVDD